MLKIRVGRIEVYDSAITARFRLNYEDEWFNDPFVKELVMEIDESEVVSADLIISPVLGPISPDRLSSGVKTLIMLYKMPEMEQWASNCGDNCLPALAEIAKMQDIVVKFSHCPQKFPDDIVAEFLDNGEIVRGNRDMIIGIIERLHGCI